MHFFVELCEDKEKFCNAKLCSFGTKTTKAFVSENCRKTCGICKNIGSSKSQATDCKQSSWGEWSKCSKSCGKGVQERTRTIVTKAQNGGKACVGNNKHSRLCNKRGCPGIKSKDHMSNFFAVGKHN